MAKAKVTADSFLKNLTMDEPTETPAPASVAKTARIATAKPSTSRVGLKHFGGYLGRDTMEKIAILRARLDLDNSELIERAIDDLHSRETAARKFGDR